MDKYEIFWWIALIGISVFLIFYSIGRVLPEYRCNETYLGKIIDFEVDEECGLLFCSTSCTITTTQTKVRAEGETCEELRTNVSLYKDNWGDYNLAEECEVKKEDEI